MIKVPLDGGARAGRLTDGVVRVLGPADQTVGAGFVVSAEGLIATCAHVIGDGEPEQPVTVVFQSTGEERQARVALAYWRERDDVAFLRLEGSLPAGVEPLALGSSAGTSGHPFHAFGYPHGPVGGEHGATGRSVTRSHTTA